MKCEVTGLREVSPKMNNERWLSGQTLEKFEYTVESFDQNVTVGSWVYV